MRRRYSSYLEERLIDRLRAYAIALGAGGRSVSLSGLLEAAISEYLEVRCDADGVPRAGSDPEPVSRSPGRGRPSNITLARRFRPRVDRTTGRYPGDQRPRGLRPLMVRDS